MTIVDRPHGLVADWFTLFRERCVSTIRGYRGSRFVALLRGPFLVPSLDVAAERVVGS